MSEQSYIIRIYRSAEDKLGRIALAGIVETPESGKREAFHDSKSLWAILTGKAKPMRPGKKSQCRNRRSNKKSDL